MDLEVAMAENHHLALIVETQREEMAVKTYQTVSDLKLIAINNKKEKQLKLFLFFISRLI